MSFTWRSDEAPPAPPAGRGARLRIALRGGAALLVLILGLMLLLSARLIEWPLCGPRRPVTPWITQGVCRAVLAILGIGYARRGRPMSGPGAMVANHASWLDILALNAGARLYFVAKAEVARWPGIGALARATGTVFIRRERRAAAQQIEIFRERLAAGHRLLFFPEGTSTDGRRVLPFRTTLFAAFLDDSLRAGLLLQPVSVVYHAPEGTDPRFYGWWGDMALGPHLKTVLGARRQGRVTVIYHPPLRAAEQPDRKALALACEGAVRKGLAEAGALDGAPVQRP